MGQCSRAEGFSIRTERPFLAVYQNGRDGARPPSLLTGCCRVAESLGSSTWSTHAENSCSVRACVWNLQTLQGLQRVCLEALDSTNLQTTVWMSSDFSSLRDVSNINDSTASPSLTQHISHLKGPILPAVQQSLNITHGLSLRQINLWKGADRLFKCSSTIFEFENARK